MAHKKAGGSSRNGRDSNSTFLNNLFQFQERFGKKRAVATSVFKSSAT